MRRRLAIVIGTWLVSAAWLGCNSILGNESAVFVPDVPETGTIDGARPDGSANDGSPQLDGDVAEDAGPCINVTTNPKHCGACFHDCLGGQCVGGTCQPIQLAVDDGRLYAIGVDTTHVYWANRTTGDIMRVPIAGGSPTRVYDGPAGTDPGKEFGIHDGHVYFAYADPNGGPGAVLRCPVTGCGSSPETVIPDLENPDFVAVQDGGVLLFTELSGRIGRCTLPCTSPVEVIATGESFPLRVAASGDTVAWSTLDVAAGGTVRAKIGDGGAFNVKSNAHPYAVAILGEEIVWAQLGQGPRAMLRDGGGPVRALTAFPAQTSYMVIENGDVYFTDSRDTIGAVHRCPASGCVDGGAPLAANQSSPNGIAVDAKSVYWTTEEDPSAVWRVAK